jgi:3-oxoadipate enol-lactonase
MDLSYRDTGQGAPLVFLHAFPLNQTMWQDQVEELSTIRRVITFDWPGFGGSRPPQTRGRDETEETPGMGRMVACLTELLDHLQLEQVDLCGLSMGGYAALALYRSAPQRIRSMILCDTRASADSQPARQARLELARRVEREGTTPLLPMMIPRLLGASSLGDQESPLIDKLSEMIAQSHPEGVAEALRSMANRAATTDLLPQIQVPTLLIVGEEDSLIQPEEMEEMATAIPNATFRIIPHAGHLPNLEQPRLFQEVMEGFLT